jgi:ATP-dependent exoDNAse (exonuclease V) alpha subunit
MIIENIHISKGAINGTIAVVTTFTFNDNKMIIGITIKVISTNIYITLSRRTLQHKYTYEAYNYKTSFSIVLAYVIIGHKAQGATITSKVFVHIKESFGLGFTYYRGLEFVQI